MVFGHDCHVFSSFNHGRAGSLFLGSHPWSSRTAMWAGIAYAIAPYHLNQLYRASMLAEYAACSVLPFAFAFVDRICRKGKGRRHCGTRSLRLRLLILLNLPLTLIGSLSLVVYAFLRIKREMFWRTLMKLALGQLDRPRGNRLFLEHRRGRASLD